MLYMISSRSIVDGISLLVCKSKLVYRNLILLIENNSEASVSYTSATRAC